VTGKPVRRDFLSEGSTPKKNSVYPAEVSPGSFPGISSHLIPDHGKNRVAHVNSGMVRIAAHKLDRLIAGSDDLLTTRLFITHRTRELEEMMTRFTNWRWNQTMASSDQHRIREFLTGSKRSQVPPDLVIPLHHMIEFLDFDRDFITSLQHDLASHIRATEQDRAALEASTSEISDLIHDAVLLPVTSIFLHFSALVREYSRKSGKMVDLIIEGDGIEMDRRILEAIKDPVMHLINNSIDHGIEYPEIRTAHGKSPGGIVRIRVIPLSGSKVGIEISDDGAGIDGNHIRLNAKKSGLITEKEARNLTDEEAIWLIFRSGFSTKPVVTDLSGRGLGLAIVEDTITRLGGDITLATGLHRGTSITLRMPVRLATLRGVVVRSGKQAYVLPMQQVRQVLRPGPGAETMQDNRPVIRIQDEEIRLISLTDALGITDQRIVPDPPGHFPVIILAYGAGQIACRVDEVIRVQEIVVRPLGSQIRRVKRITGAAILGDGTMALVLDPIEIIHETQKPGPDIPRHRSSRAGTGRILVVEDSVTSRTLLQATLDQAGYMADTAIDGNDAFNRLKEKAYDLVVSDVDMPRMNGFLLTEKIRGNPRLAKIPIILVTSLDSPEDHEHGIAMGADEYLVKKGFDKTRFLKKVAALLKKNRNNG
jgi:two-component system chemotaxis sensor kinase CheA